MVQLTRAERETIIRWSEADEFATIYSDSAKVQRRMVARGWPNLDETSLGKRTWLVPVGAVRLPGRREAHEARKVSRGNPEALAAARAKREVPEGG